MRRDGDHWSLAVEYIEERPVPYGTIPPAHPDTGDELEAILADLLMDYWLTSEAERLSADVEPEPASREDYETATSK